MVSLNEENKKVFVSENMDIQKLQKRFKELDFESASFFQDEDFPNDEAVLKIVDGRV